MPRGANYWPTEEQALLLRAGLLDETEAIAAWRRVAPGLDLARLDDASQRLLPLVYRNLARHGVTVPNPAPLAAAYQTTWSWNQRLFQRTTEVLAVLDRAGIDAIVLKGMALMATCYRDLGARPMGDVDILVPAPLAARALEALNVEGWVSRYSITPAFMRVKHASPMVGRRGEECDLHWRTFEEAAEAGADEELWAASRRVEFHGARFRVFCPTDQLLHVCIHGARWAWLPGVRWVADALLILRAGGIDWERLVAQAVARRFVLRLRETLCYLDSFMGGTVSSDALVRLSRCPISFLERVESRVRAREHRLLGELPVYWCHYLRTRQSCGMRPFGFARYLQEAWGLESMRRVPGRGMALATRRLLASLGRS
jgi:Uncharacterised nucleotidyltransferase